MKIKRILNTIFNSTPDDQHDNHDGSHHDIYQFIGFLVVLSVLLLYIVVGSWMEHMAFRVGHETGAIILICMCISLATTSVLKDHT